MNTNVFLMSKYGISEDVVNFVSKAEADISDIFAKFDETMTYCNYKVLESFKHCEIAARHMYGTTGYGYSDSGREKLAELFARIFGAESAVVSPLIASGTHALSTALFGLLRPGDTMLSITGNPYDTLHGVIGISSDSYKDSGSLKDFGVKYSHVDLLPDGSIDTKNAIIAFEKINRRGIFYIQRSRGYEWRASLSIENIKRAIADIKKAFPNSWVVVDNCYGEFTEPLEPTDVGADLIIGSLIKNPGAGLAPTGAYIAGRRECVELAEQRLTCAGLGSEIGSYLSGYLPYFQGIFFAPSVVRNALCGAALSAEVFSRLGFEVFPSSRAHRADITQAIKMNSEDALTILVRAVQKASPIDSNVVPYAWDMPGYDDKVIMAAGTFIQGGSIELSADGPMREPYIAYMQGGLTLDNVRLALMLAVQDLRNKLNIKI